MSTAFHERLAARQDLSQVAAIPPPPGVTQNFKNPPTTGDDAYTLVAIGVAIAGILLIMRLYTKGIILRKFGWEDIAILMAFLLSTADCILILEGRKYGTGKHLWDVPLSVLVPNWGKIVLSAVVVYAPAIMFSKIAVLLCYLRISTKSIFRTAVYVVMGIVFSYNIAIMLSLIFACQPIAKSWNATLPGKCINQPSVYLANGVLNVASDFIILLLPAPMVRDLQISSRSKILLIAMFSVGSLTAIVSIVRLKTLIPTLHSVDQTWALSVPGNWIIVELNLAVACGCLATLRPFLRHHFPRLLGETRNSRSEQYNKASRSDYFSRSNRSHNSNKHRAQNSSTESRDRLSHGHGLPSWDAVGYSQEIKTSAVGGTQANAYSMDDIELGQTTANASAAPGKETSVFPYPSKKSGDYSQATEISQPQSVAMPEYPMGIVKTLEVDVRR